MFEITDTTASEYLRRTGRLAAWEPAEVRALEGGVSNIVLLVSLGSGERFVLKQARGQLRVKEQWLCPVERIWREVETLRLCGQLLTSLRGSSPAAAAGGFAAAFEAGVPELLWEDRENYCYAMTAAPAGHRTWKEMLLAGDWMSGLGLATACGQLLAELHSRSWRDPRIAAALDDRIYFEQLRIDPYYRHTAHRHPDRATHLQSLIDSVGENRWCLVHGDFSPKNLLVWAGQVMLIDFEVGHFGDPAFDLGFFLTHLVLKSVWAGPRRDQYLMLVAAFWNTYRRRLAAGAPADLDDLEQRTLWNLAGCMLARVDGKSPVDYLDNRQQDVVRCLARDWLVVPPSGIEAAQLALKSL